MSDSVKNIFIIFIGAVVFIYSCNHSKLFKSDKVKGYGYTFVIPAGWEKSAELSHEGKYSDPETMTRTIVLIPVDQKSRKGGPNTTISLSSKKLERSFWIEDEFPLIINALTNQGFRIIQKGEIKINEQLSKWVLYQDMGTAQLTLDFYMISENNIFYEIKMITDPENFDKYRPSFEELKSTFKSKMLSF